MHPTYLVVYECLRLLPTYPAALMRAGPSPASTSTTSGSTSLPACLASLGGRSAINRRDRAWWAASEASGNRRSVNRRRRRCARTRRSPFTSVRAVEVFDPIDRNLAYAQAALLGQQEQLGVEEPLAVLDLRQELLCNAALDRLEAALGVGEVVAEEDLYKEVVAARD